MEQVRDIMFRDLVTVSEDESIFNAVRLILSKRISCLVVLEDQKIKGILTSRDVLDKVVGAGLDPKYVRVADIMTRRVVVTKPERDLMYLTATMNINKIKQVPVVENDRAIGIVTQTDIIRHFIQLKGTAGIFFKANKNY